MIYEKHTLDTFKAKLKNGDYESLTGARRAIGKMQSFSDKDKDKARALANEHFGEDASASAKPAAKKAAKTAAKKAAKKPGPKPKAAATAAEHVAKKPGPKPGRKPMKRALRTEGNQAVGSTQGRAYESDFNSLVDVTAEVMRNSPNRAVNVATRVIESAQTAFTAVAAMKADDPSLDISEVCGDSHQAIRLATRVLQETMATIVAAPQTNGHTESGDENQQTAPAEQPEVEDVDPEELAAFDERAKQVRAGMHAS